MPVFTHLHSHTQYSLLDGASSVEGIMKKAKADGMPAVALTDHGNMFGAFHFVNEANKHGVKPIVGCEFYVVEDRFVRSFTGGKKDKRYHQLLLAKNQKGYENLSKLCSLGFIEGLYKKYPRVDKDLIKQYSEGIIATSCCLAAEVPQAILNYGEEEAERVFQEWHAIFGDDYYVELQRHGLENINGTGLSQEDINQVLIKFARKYNVPIIATNDSHYVEEEDWGIHDILLCVNTGEMQSTPVGDGKGFRFGFPNSNFYFKSQAEMNTLFADIPESIDNTNLIVDKVTPPVLARDILLPNYTLPDGFETQADYLRFLAFEGAKKRYGEITSEIEERINFELKVINDSGYPGYFLIVQDFTTAARTMNVSVGPGRGSAAGSVIAYALGITNVDPIKYDLLFERFLNPERVSMPDIDIDFDDEGRDKVLKYVIDKYGKNQVAQIITYGTMAAKSSVRDVGRVLDVPLSEVNKTLSFFPENLSASLNGVLADEDISPKLKDKLTGEDLQKAYQFREIAQREDEIGDMLRKAKRLEGSIRNTGVHACGVIITPDDMSKFVPLTVAKDSDIYLTQFDNNVVESAGLLKMDFLGLKTLTIIKDAVELIKHNHGVDIIPDEIPLDDEKTFELFQRGDTSAIFQYESDGMRKYMRDLKPTEFADLIAMNALYRPGPLQYIPDFIDRKHGRKQITYDLPEMEEYLAETYGITVYQEQVMLLSQKLANFSKGEADALRKAMGKKKKDVLDEMFPRFVAGCTSNGHPEDIVQKVWNDWEAFASYAFNKSHSTCYAYVAFQTAYLKAHYPAEYMAAVLTNNMRDIKTITKYMDESKAIGVKVLGPDVNESYLKFSVNKEGAIRFGLAAIKGVGEKAMENLVEERNNGQYTSLFDIAKRLDLRVTNKRTFENLIHAGALDEFGISRSRYFALPNHEQENSVEKAIKYGKRLQEEENSAQQSLFGSLGAGTLDIPEPKIPMAEDAPLIERLNREREVVGVFISGHPLDKYKLVYHQYTNVSIPDIDSKMKDKTVRIAGIISKAQERLTKKGDRFAIITLEDYEGAIEIPFFSNDYDKYRQWLHENELIYLEGEYEKRWRDSDEYRLKVNAILPLDKVLREFTKAVQVSIPADKINEQFIIDFTEITTTHKGQIPIQFMITGDDKETYLKLFSRNTLVEINESLLRQLALIPNSEVQLLKSRG